jgi:hypothetical protein
MAQYTEHHLMLLEKGDMTVEEFDSLLCEYVDDELPKTIRLMMDAKADKCSICAELKRTYLLTVKLASTLSPSFELSEEASDRIRQKLNERLGINITFPVRDHLN